VRSERRREVLRASGKAKRPNGVIAEVDLSAGNFADNPTNRELDGHQGRLLLRRDCLQIFQRPAERLIRSAELHVGLRDFDDYVPIGGPNCRLKLDDNLEIWTVLTDKCFS
jgi:hypothetical protein